MLAAMVRERMIEGRINQHGGETVAPSHMVSRSKRARGSRSTLAHPWQACPNTRDSRKVSAEPGSSVDVSPIHVLCSLSLENVAVLVSGSAQRTGELICQRTSRSHVSHDPCGANKLESPTRPLVHAVSFSGGRAVSSPQLSSVIRNHRRRGQPADSADLHPLCPRFEKPLGRPPLGAED